MSAKTYASLGIGLRPITQYSLSLELAPYQIDLFGGADFVHNINVPNIFKQGEHICALYHTPDEQLAIAAEYLGDGLRQGERCFYVADSRAALKRFRTTLANVGIDGAEAVRRGALIEATHAEAHTAGGRFDSERMIRLLNEAVESALNEGFKGLRTCGDMSWLLEEWDGREQARQYEAFLNEFFRGVRGAGMCQYDRARFPLHVIDGALATHSTFMLEGRHQPNPLYKPSAERLKVTRP